LIIIGLLVLFIIVASIYFGSRGFFVGTIIIYLFALKDLVKQLPDIAKKSKKKLYFLCLYYPVVTIVLFAFLYKTMW
jgi:hypothetical protein